MARVQDLKVRLECDTDELERQIRIAELQVEKHIQKHLCDAMIYGTPYWAKSQVDTVKKIQQIYREFKERESQMKKLYTVFVIEGQEKVHEVSLVSESSEGAKFDAVKSLDLDTSYDALDVYAQEVFTLKKRNCC